jgi:thiol-disulfide isomerase/thioredoxin
MRQKAMIVLLFTLYLVTASAQTGRTLRLKDFVLEDVNGKPYNLNALKGKVLFVDCWYPACPPCRGEMPWEEFLMRRVKKMGFDTGIVFLSICFKQSREEWLDALKKIPVPGNIHLYAAGGKYLNQLVIDKSFPTYRLFNTKGELDKTECPSPSEFGYVDFVLFAQSKQVNVKTATKFIKTNDKGIKPDEIENIKDPVLRSFTKSFFSYREVFMAEYEHMLKVLSLKRF